MKGERLPASDRTKGVRSRRDGRAREALAPFHHVALGAAVATVCWRAHRALSQLSAGLRTIPGSRAALPKSLVSQRLGLPYRPRGPPPRGATTGRAARAVAGRISASATPWRTAMNAAACVGGSDVVAGRGDLLRGGAGEREGALIGARRWVSYPLKVAPLRPYPWRRLHLLQCAMARELWILLRRPGVHMVIPQQRRLATCAKETTQIKESPSSLRNTPPHQSARRNVAPCRGRPRGARPHVCGAAMSWRDAGVSSGGTRAAGA